MIEPLLSASVTALCRIGEHSPGPARLRLITRAGLGLAGTPATARPLAQRMPSAMSDIAPPHFPITRTLTIGLVQLTPDMPLPLLTAAPSVPATIVPCHVLFVTPQPCNAPPAVCDSSVVTKSPGSDASPSRPSPSPENRASATKS